MSRDVAKLKNLLFDNEHRTLINLERRIESIADDFGPRLKEVFDRAGTTERFQESVADVLDRALRDAEVKHHAELSDAIAPLVVKTIKTEIHNSQDELVDALYPMTGRMVKAYVASAMKDVIDRINNQLEQNPVLLRFKSWTTGRSVTEIALASAAQKLEIEELYLIRRGSGELVARWPAAAGDARDQVMSGILSAINDFAIEAFKSEASSLRQIDLGGSQVYLRASPTLLLAAKCTGTAPAVIEEAIDDEFMNALEHERQSSTGQANGTPGSTGDTPRDENAFITELADNLEKRIDEKQAELDAAPAGFSPATAIMWVVGLCLTGWLSWTLYEAYGSSRVRALATRVIESSPDIKGYPAKIIVAPYGRSLKLAGLVPSIEAKSNIVQQLRSVLPATNIDNQLTIVHVSDPELEVLRGDMAGLRARMQHESAERAALRARQRLTSVERAAHRARQRLTSVGKDLSLLSTNVKDARAKQIVDKTSSSIDDVVGELSNYIAISPDAPVDEARVVAMKPSLDGIADRLRQTSQNLEALLISGNKKSAASQTPAQPATSKNVADAAEQVALQAERLATLAAAVSQASAVKPPPAKIIRPVVTPPPLSPRKRVEAWTQANAIFFSADTDYRDPQSAQRKLSELAQLARETGLVIRIVGYTDDQGNQRSNESLSVSRAEKVRVDLVKRGVVAARLVTVGRKDARDLSNERGAGSPNRRVEFEVGFIGEVE